ENGADDLPLRFGTVLAREQRQVALYGVANQPLISVHFFSPLVQHIELDILASHHLTWRLGPCAYRDHNLRRKPEAEIIGLAGPVSLEDLLRRTIQVDGKLGPSHCKI